MMNHERLRIAIAAFLLAWCVSPVLSRVASSADSGTTLTLDQLSQTSYLRGDFARITLRYSGLYKITGADLAKAGIPIGQVNPAKLALFNEGEAVPILVNAKGSALGPADTIQFIGQPPRGTYTTYKPLNLRNVYFLTWNADKPLHYKEVVDSPADAARGVAFMELMHLEKDLRLRYSTAAPGLTDNFFWILQAAGATETFPLRISFPGIVRSAGISPKVTIGLFGQNEAAGVTPSHQFEILYGDDSLGTFSFNGIVPYRAQTSLSLNLVKDESVLLKVRAPVQRRDVVDMVALDWIELEYPRALDMARRGLFAFNTRLVGGKRPAWVALANAPLGTRVFDPKRAEVYSGQLNDGSIAVRVADVPTSLTAATPEVAMAPDEINFRTADNNWSRVPSDTSLLILYHPRFERPAQAYATYRRERGVPTVAVDAARVFDNVDYGFVSDSALKQFTRLVKQQAPGLQSIFLIGDSTNDYRETNYEESELMEDPVAVEHEVFLPIHWVFNPSTTHNFGYPDDNWFGAFRQPNAPDVAVGRLPANTEDDVWNYLRKVIEHENLKQTANGNLLLVSSIESGFQQMVLDVKTKIGDKFSSSVVLFPQTNVADKEVKRLLEDFDAGPQVLYYVGHGGSFVWRVGPTDYQRQKDLFTPREVDQLTNAKRYPLVVCSSCYTTSFDNRLSLGEAMLLKPEAGAVAVLGTPWKTGVYESHAFNDKLLTAYIDPNTKSLGQAFMYAKNQLRPPSADYVDFQTFTMMADPALELVRRSDASTTALQAAAARRSYVYEVHNDQVYLKDVDATPRDTVIPVGEWRPDDPGTLPANRVYRKRLIIQDGGVVRTAPVTIPEGTTRAVIVMRGENEMLEFPSARITAKLAGSPSSPEVVLFAGVVSTRSFQNFKADLPSALVGKPVEFAFQMTNPDENFDKRQLRIGRIIFEQVEKAKP